MNITLNRSDVFGCQLSQYASLYGKEPITVYADGGVLSDENVQTLLLCFPLCNIVSMDSLCCSLGKDFYSLSENDISPECRCLILEPAANRLDYLAGLLKRKNVSPCNILKGASEHWKILDIGSLLRLQHFDSVEYHHDTFSRYAIIIRLLFIESFYQQQRGGYELYDKYLSAKNYGPADYFRSKFEELICSFERNTHQDLWIATDRDGRIIDGSHRMALCLYWGIRSIPVRYMNTEERIDSGFEWLKQNFLPLEIETILGKYDEIKRRYLGSCLQII